MAWLRNCFGKTFSAVFERDIYSLVLVKGYLKTLHIVFLTILITIICSSAVWSGFFKLSAKDVGFVNLGSYLLMIFTFLRLCSFYSGTDFFRRFSPLMLWGLSYLISLVLYFLGSILPPEQLTFLFSNEYLKSSNLKQNLSDTDYVVAWQFTIFLNSWFKLFFIFIFFVINRDYWKEILHRFRNSPASFLCYLLYVVLVFNWLYLSSSPGDLPEKIAESQNQKYIKELYANGSPLFLFSFYFSGILIIPFWEEMIYRYLPTEIFGCKKGAIPLFFFATLWFVMIHVHPEDLKLIVNDSNPVASDTSFWTYVQNLFKPALFGYWLMSFVFITIYWIADFNLVYSFIWHFFANVFAFSFFS